MERKGGAMKDYLIGCAMAASCGLSLVLCVLCVISGDRLSAIIHGAITGVLGFQTLVQVGYFFLSNLVVRVRNAAEVDAR